VFHIFRIRRIGIDALADALGAGRYGEVPGRASIWAAATIPRSGQSGWTRAYIAAPNSIQLSFLIELPLASHLQAFPPSCPGALFRALSPSRKEANSIGVLESLQSSLPHLSLSIQTGCGEPVLIRDIMLFIEETIWEALCPLKNPVVAIKAFL